MKTVASRERNHRFGRSLGETAHRGGSVAFPPEDED
jgi:hypothetical protein